MKKFNIVMNSGEEYQVTDSEEWIDLFVENKLENKIVKIKDSWLNTLNISSITEIKDNNIEYDEDYEFVHT